MPTTPDPSPWLNKRHGRLTGDVDRLREAGQFTECARVLAERGAELLAAGGAATIVATVRALPKETRPAGLMLVYGDALRYRGESDAALEVYARLAEGGAQQTAGLAWRVGLIHYLRGEPERALEAYAGARLGTERSLDEAVLLAWTAAAFWMVGDAAGCADRAERARRAAEAVGDDGVRAGAHIALALLASLTGDLAGNQEHYDRALRLAESAADAMQATRIHSNRAGCLLDEGRYVEALNEARSAVVMAERTGYEAFLGTALVNEGEALDRLGHLAEAVARYERAVPIFQRMGSRKAAVESPAHARCKAVNNAVTSTLIVSGTTYVSEKPVTGTCNNNDHYSSSFKSHFAGWRASVWIQNNGLLHGHFGGMNTAWYSLVYTDNNSNSEIHLCLDNGTKWYCGWGTKYTKTNSVSHANSGLNKGF